MKKANTSHKKSRNGNKVRNSTAKNPKRKRAKQKGGEIGDDEITNIASDVASEVAGAAVEELKDAVHEDMAELNSNINNGLKELESYFNDNINELANEVLTLSESLKEVADEIVPQIGVIIRNHEKELLKKVDDGIKANNVKIIQYVNELFDKTNEENRRYKESVRETILEFRKELNNEKQDTDRLFDLTNQTLEQLGKWTNRITTLEKKI